MPLWRGVEGEEWRQEGEQRGEGASGRELTERKHQQRARSIILWNQNYTLGRVALSRGTCSQSKDAPEMVFIPETQDCGLKEEYGLTLMLKLLSSKLAMLLRSTRG